MKLAEILKELEIANGFINRAQGHEVRENYKEACHYYNEVILKMTPIMTSLIMKLKQINQIANE